MTDTHAPSTPFLPAAAEAGDLEDWGPLAEATGPEMHTAGITIWQDGDDEAGIWECTPGPSRWLLETNELVHVVRGRIDRHRRRRRAGRPRTGGHRRVPEGLERHVEIHETLRKVYAIY